MKQYPWWKKLKVMWKNEIINLIDTMKFDQVSSRDTHKEFSFKNCETISFYWIPSCFYTFTSLECGSIIATIDEKISSISQVIDSIEYDSDDLLHLPHNILWTLFFEILRPFPKLFRFKKNTPTYNIKDKTTNVYYLGINDYHPDVFTKERLGLARDEFKPAWYNLYEKCLFLPSDYFDSRISKWIVHAYCQHQVSLFTNLLYSKVATIFHDFDFHLRFNLPLQSHDKCLQLTINSNNKYGIYGRTIYKFSALLEKGDSFIKCSSNNRTIFWKSMTWVDKEIISILLINLHHICKYYCQDSRLSTFNLILKNLYQTRHLVSNYLENLALTKKAIFKQLSIYFHDDVLTILNLYIYLDVQSFIQMETH